MGIMPSKSINEKIQIEIIGVINKSMDEMYLHVVI